MFDFARTSGIVSRLAMPTSARSSTVRGTQNALLFFLFGLVSSPVIKVCFNIWQRCLLTTVWPDKGIKDPSQEPLKTLKE